MADHNTTRAAEKSAILLDQILETARSYGYEIIRNVLVNNPPNGPDLIVDPVLVLQRIFDKLEEDYIKRNLTRGGKNNEYIVTTTDPELKNRRFS